MAAEKNHDLAKLVSLVLAFWLIFSLSAFSLISSGSIKTTTLETTASSSTAFSPLKTIAQFPKANIKYAANQVAANEKCNFSEPACKNFPYDCICTTNENEFLEVTITYDWNGVFPPGTPMCVRPSVIPLGASAPAAQGIGGATITLAWTPTFCQSGNYTVFYDIGRNCTEELYADFYYIHAINADRQPSIQTAPAGPIEVNMRQPVHIDVAASDPDTLECTDAQNKDVLALTKTQGPGNFVDHGNGDGDFDWNSDLSGNHTILFNVSDGKGGAQSTPVNINVLPVVPNPAQPEPVLVKKNRYISFKPTNPGIMTALRVKLTSLNHPNPTFPNPSPFDFSGYESQYRWVGPPQEYTDAPFGTFIAAKLQCDPYYTDWSTVGLANVYGEEIVPSSIYQVQAVSIGCNVNDSSCYSTPLNVETGRLGDIVSEFSTPGGPSQPDALDIASLINKFKGMPGTPAKTQAQLQPGLVNPAKTIDAIDITLAINSFKGYPYPYGITTSCGTTSGSSASSITGT